MESKNKTKTNEQTKQTENKLIDIENRIPEVTRGEGGWSGQKG